MSRADWRICLACERKNDVYLSDAMVNKSTKELFEEYSRIFLASDKASVLRVREIVEELQRRAAMAQLTVPKRRTPPVLRNPVGQENLMRADRHSGPGRR